MHQLIQLAYNVCKGVRMLCSYYPYRRHVKELLVYSPDSSRILCDLLTFVLINTKKMICNWYNVIVIFATIKPLDVPKCLKELRDQRMHLVQMVGQYKFVYSAVVQYIKSARLI